MKKKLKKYQDFLNEASTSEKLPTRVLPVPHRETYLQLRVEFRDDLEGLSDYYDTKFSNLCQNRDNDPDEDYLEMKKLLARKGWTIESIKNLFSPEADKACKYNFFNLASGRSSDELKTEFNNRTLKSQFYQPFREKSLDEISGYIDIFMYKLVEELKLTNTFNYAQSGKIYLGGEGWQDLDNNDTENEYLIKCAYGYHHTKYGKLFLNQIGLSEEELIRKAIQDFQTWIEQEWMSIVDEMIPGVNGRNISSKMEFNDFFLVENDRIVIFCKAISEHLIQNGVNISTEDVVSKIMDSLSIFKLGTGDSPLDVEITGSSDIVIWGEFVESHS